MWKRIIAIGQYGKIENKRSCTGDIMNGKLIVLEGIDGSGKATQSGLWRIILLRVEKMSCIFLFLIMEVLPRRW